MVARRISIIRRCASERVRTFCAPRTKLVAKPRFNTGLLPRVKFRSYAELLSNLQASEESQNIVFATFDVANRVARFNAVFLARKLKHMLRAFTRVEIRITR